VRPKVKYAVIYRHREAYPVSVMCKFFGVSRSGYYEFVKRLDKPESDTDLTDKIKECQRKTDNTYGYRRVWKWLRDRNVHRDPKTVLRIMKKYGLLSEIRRRRKWVNLGQQVHKYENLLKRQFRAERPIKTKYFLHRGFLCCPYKLGQYSRSSLFAQNDLLTIQQVCAIL
jgi:hypothetical protein